MPAERLGSSNVHLPLGLIVRLLIGFCFVSGLFAQDYDMILKGGHVIDPKNQISGRRDVAIKGGKIAAVAANIDAAKGKQLVNVSGLYVTPGLVDIHVHVFAGTGERNSYAGDFSVYPDGFTFRSGVTTVVDAGSSGWRNFEDFEDRVDEHADAEEVVFTTGQVDDDDVFARRRVLRLAQFEAGLQVDDGQEPTAQVHDAGQPGRSVGNPREHRRVDDLARVRQVERVELLPESKRDIMGAFFGLGRRGVHGRTLLRSGYAPGKWGDRGFKRRGRRRRRSESQGVWRFARPQWWSDGCRRAR